MGLLNLLRKELNLLRKEPSSRKKSRASSIQNKPGRPPGRPKRRVNLYLAVELIPPFRKLCNEHGLSLSEGVIILIEQALRKRAASKRLLGVKYAAKQS